MVEFAKAKKEKCNLRAAITGPSGSGKTYSSLRIATGIGGKIAFVDSERGSAKKYADRFSFDVLELEDKSIDGYCAAMHAAEKAGYKILVIDSLTHAWQELLIEVDRIAKTKFHGNSFAAWNEGTPKQRKLIDAILNYDGHIIATMRSKIKYEQTNENGKTKVTKLGLDPEQGKGIEYEFDVLIDIQENHFASISKDRTGKFQDKIYDRITEDFGRELAVWLNDGSAAEQKQTNKIDDQKIIESEKITTEITTRIIDCLQIDDLKKIGAELSDLKGKLTESHIAELRKAYKLREKSIAG